MASYRWHPGTYARNARYVADLATDVVALLAPQPCERILDLGCGDGALTERVGAFGSRVLGADANPEMVAAARARGVKARVLDAEQLEFDAEFDAVFSNQALHWMRRADDVIEGIWRALQPGGRFIAECGGRGCIETIVSALYEGLARRGIDGSQLNPWYFPSPDDYGERLTRAGFRVDFIALIRRPTLLPGDIDSWMETFAKTFTDPLPASERKAFIDDVRELLRPKLCRPDGVWVADYMLLRFMAIKVDA